MRKIPQKWMLILFVMGRTVVAQGAELFVSPNGNDAGDGTRVAPFRTLERARKAVRVLKSQTSNDIHVRLLPGRFVLNETFVLRVEDGGRPGQQIFYEGADAENPPVLVSEVIVKDWRQLETPVPNQSDEAKGKLWEADLPEGLGRIYTLYDGDIQLPISSYSFDSTEPLFGETLWRTELCEKLYFPKGVLRAYENIEDIEISVYPRQRWMHHILRLKEVREKESLAIPTRGGESGLSKSPQRMNAITVLNTIDYLDSPGEWCVNTRSRKIYYWPTSGSPSDQINASRLREYILVEGNIDYNAPTDIPVRNIHFKNIIFTKAERGFQEDDDATAHSEWAIYDKDNAALRFRGAESCSVDNITIFNSGGCGIRLDLYCQNIVVANSKIHHVGKSGVVIAGYGPGLKNVNHHNLIVNCEIRDVGEWHRNGHAVFLTQTHDTVVRNCKIYNTPMMGVSIVGFRYWTRRDKAEYRAVRRQDLPQELLIRTFEEDRPFDGVTDKYHSESARMRMESGTNWFNYLDYVHTQDNRVEFCDISRTCQDLGDCNAVYIHTSGPGNTVYYNFVHDIEGKEKSTAFRSDDVQEHSVFSHNIVYNIRTEGGINFSLNAEVLNNYFIDIDGYYLLMHTGDKPNTSLVERNICYDHSNPEFLFVRLRKDKEETEKAKYLSVRVNNNLFFSEKLDVEHGVMKLKKEKAGGKGNRYADPKFVDFCNFKLAEDSPAFEMGIEQVDLSMIGLLNKPFNTEGYFRSKTH